MVALPDRPLRLHRPRLPVRRRGRPGDLRDRPRAAPRQRSPPALLMVACGSLGMLAAAGDRQRPGRHRGDGRRQRHGAGRARRLVRDPPRRGAPGDRPGVRPGRRRGRRRRSCWRCRSSSRPPTPTPASSAALVGGLAGLLAAAALRTVASRRLVCGHGSGRRAAGGRDRAADRLRALRRGGADRLAGGAAAAARARHRPRRGRLVRRVAPGRGPEGRDRPRPGRAHRRGPRPARRGGEDGDDGRRRRRLGTERGAERTHPIPKERAERWRSSSTAIRASS